MNRQDGVECQHYSQHWGAPSAFRESSTDSSSRQNPLVMRDLANALPPIPEHRVRCPRRNGFYHSHLLQSAVLASIEACEELSEDDSNSCIQETSPSHSFDNDMISHYPRKNEDLVFKRRSDSTMLPDDCARYEEQDCYDDDDDEPPPPPPMDQDEHISPYRRVALRRDEKDTPSSPSLCFRKYL